MGAHREPVAGAVTGPRAFFARRYRGSDTIAFMALVDYRRARYEIWQAMWPRGVLCPGSSVPAEEDGAPGFPEPCPRADAAERGVHNATSRGRFGRRVTLS